MEQRLLLPRCLPGTAARALLPEHWCQHRCVHSLGLWPARLWTAQLPVPTPSTLMASAAPCAMVSGAGLRPGLRGAGSSCCLLCSPDCNYEGRKVANGQVFVLDDEPCTRCTCQVSQAHHACVSWCLSLPTLLMTVSAFSAGRGEL